MNFDEEKVGKIRMNKFLRAVGFDGYQNREKIEQLYKEEEANIPGFSVESGMMAKKLECFPGGGLLFVGNEKDREFQLEYCIPYLEGKGVMQVESVSVEEKTQGNLYSAAIEDFRIGVFVIFHLINGLSFAELTREGGKDLKNTRLAFSALSLTGKVILPLAYTESERREKEVFQKRRTQMIAAARQGNEQAMEELAHYDMNTYARVAQRVNTEDILSVVATSFIPYGIECDQYAVIAEIVAVESVKNRYTEEELWKLCLDYNGIRIDLCMKKEDLLGEPIPGRRFKGNIWLQGIVEKH